MKAIRFINYFIIAILLSLIVALPIALYLIKFNSDSFIGGTLKQKLLHYSSLVKLINLDDSGDLKYFYAETQKPISVEIVSVNFKKYNPNVEKWLSEMLQTSLGKRTQVSSDNISYSKLSLLQDSDLDVIRNVAISNTNADLYLIYTSSYADKPTSVGLVNHRDTIFMFDDALDSLTNKGYVRDILEKTTIMHEWGHLLGLEHIDNQQCIMNELVEVYDTQPVGKPLPTKYCYEELQQIKNLTK